MNDNYEKDAKVFKAVCDEKRLQILELLRDGEKCACVLTELTGIKQSALSYHMRILCESGIVIGKQDGKWTHYCIDREGSETAIQLLNTIVTPSINQIDNKFYLDKLEKTEKPSC